MKLGKEFLLAFAGISILMLLSTAISVSADVFINEFLADPAGNDGGKEWVELYNDDVISVDLTNWNITDNTAPTKNFSISATIPAKGFVVLVTDFSIFNSLYPNVGANNVAIANASSGFGISNPGGNGSELILYNDSGILVDIVEYADSQDGTSIGRYPDGSLNILNLSTQTPGFQNDEVPPSFPSLAINNSNPKRNDAVQISANCSDDVVLSMCIFSWNGTGIWVNASDSGVVELGSFNFSVNMTITLPHGSVIGYLFYANDSHNKLNSSGLNTFEVANTPPEMPTILFPANNLLTNNPKLDINVTFPEDMDNEPLNISYYINGTLNQTSFSNITINFPDGQHWINVSISDGFASGDNATVNITVDATQPLIAGLRSNDTDNITRSNVMLNFSAVAQDANLVNVALNGTLMEKENSLYKLSINISELGCVSEGKCLLNATAIDTAGNENSIAYSLIIDNQKPAFSNPVSIPATKFNTVNITLNVTWSDENGIFKVIFVHNASGSFQGFEGVPAGQSYTVEIDSALLEKHQAVGWNSAAIDFADNQNDSMLIQTFEIENRAPTIAGFFPGENPLVAEFTGRQKFNVTAVDLDNDVLEIIWQLNGTTNTTGNQFTAENLSEGIYNVTATVTDGDSNVSNSWNLTVSSVPVSKKYQSAIFSLNKSQLENVTNVTINETNFGSIDFGNNTLNLSGVADIDNIINISSGVAAIDTDKYPALNQSAKILWKGFNFTKAPFLFTSSGFKAQGAVSCSEDVCLSKTYNSSSGIYSFNAAHFTTYFTSPNTTNDKPRIISAPAKGAALDEPYTYQVSVSDLDNSTFIFTLPEKPSGMSVSPNGLISLTPKELGTFNVTVNVSDGIDFDIQSYNLTVTPGARLRIKDLDIKIDGSSTKNVKNNTEIRKDAEPGNRVSFKIELENKFTREEGLDINNINVEVRVEDIDDGDDIEDESREFDLSPENDKRVNLEVQVPIAVEEGAYRVIIIADGRDDNGTTHELKWGLELDVNKEKHMLVVDRLTLSPNTVGCNRKSQISARVLNLGEDEEDDVTLEIKSPALGISSVGRGIVLDEGSDLEDIAFVRNLQFSVDNSVGQGEYPITVTAYRDDRLEDKGTVNLNVVDCVAEKKVEKREEIIVIKPKEKEEKPKLGIIPKKPVKVSFKQTDEYLLLLIVSVFTLTIITFIFLGALMVYMKR